MSANLISAALSRIRPGSEWSLTGENLSGFVWLDQHQPRPTDIEINEEVARLVSEGYASRYRVLKSTIIFRLTDQQLAAASEAFARPENFRLRERWYAPDQPAINSDDQQSIAFILAIGADPEIVLAPE